MRTRNTKLVITGPSLCLDALGLGGEHDEARGVVLGILDIGARDLETVDFGGKLRGDHGRAAVARFAQMTGSAGSVGFRHRLQFQRADGVAALAERHDVAVHRFQFRQLDAGKREQLMTHPLEMLGDDMQARMRQEMMDVGDAPGHGILDRDHGELGGPALYGGQRVLEGGTGKRLHARIGVERGKMRIGARLALEGDSV